MASSNTAPATTTPAPQGKAARKAARKALVAAATGKPAKAPSSPATGRKPAGGTNGAAAGNKPAAAQQGGKAGKGKQPPAKPARALPTKHGVPVAVAPVQGRGGNRVTVYGYNVCAVLRWYGANGHGAAAAHAMLRGLGLGEVVGGNTVGCQVYGHATRGTPAPLTAAQGKALLAVGSKAGQ
jgi:hypothetical protein